MVGAIVEPRKQLEMVAATQYDGFYIGDVRVALFWMGVDAYHSAANGAGYGERRRLLGQRQLLSCG